MTTRTAPDARTTPDVRSRAAAEEVPGWAGGAMLWLRRLTLLVEVNVMVLLGTLAGGVVLGLAPALRAGSRVTDDLAGEPAPWRTFWSTWHRDWARTNLLALPYWVVAALLVLDRAVALQVDGSLRAVLQAGILLVTAWSAVSLAYWPRVALRYDRGVLETWRFLLLAPLLGPGTALAVLVVLCSVAVMVAVLPVTVVLFAVALWLWATGRVVDERLRRLDAAVGAHGAERAGARVTPGS